MALHATDVFVPGSFPRHTYIERKNERLETVLRDAIATPGFIIALSGPSKSGKTVLVEKVVGIDSIVSISGAGITSPDDMWTRVLDKMGYANSEAEEESRTSGGSAGVEAGGGVNVWGVVKGEAKGKGEINASRSEGSTVTKQRRGVTQILEVLANSQFVLLIDDFHYMPREVQVEAAKALKEVVRQGVKVITAQVNYRGDDVVRALPELRGRVSVLDIKYWNAADLAGIAVTGFTTMGLGVNPEIVNRCASEAAGSPQLMQSICLQTCIELGHRVQRERLVAIRMDEGDLHAIFKATSATADFRSLVRALDDGPRTRGVERKNFKFKDGTEGDVYRCVLKAIAADPPLLSFSYDNVMSRIAQVCEGASPVGSSVSGTLSHMARLALDQSPNERVLDWEEGQGILELPDPYFLFYLRWSDGLRHPSS